MSNPDHARLAGTACVAGGALQLASIAIGIEVQNTLLAGSVVWGLAAVCLMGGPLGLLALRAADGRRLGYAGAALALLGPRARDARADRSGLRQRRDRPEARVEHQDDPHQVSNVFDKLQVTDRAHAIIKAREAGLGR